MSERKSRDPPVCSVGTAQKARVRRGNLRAKRPIDGADYRIVPGEDAAPQEQAGRLDIGDAAFFERAEQAWAGWRKAASPSGLSPGEARRREIGLE